MKIRISYILPGLSAIILFIVLLFVQTPGLYAQDFWTQQNGPYGGTAASFAADTNGIIYGGTQYGGLQKSEDFGSTWAQTGWFGSVLSMIVSKKNDLYFPGYNSVSKSVDGAVTFEQLTNGLPERFSATSFAENLNGDIFVSSDSGLYVSKDDGGTWIYTNSDLPSKTIRRVFVSSDNHIYVNVYSVGVYRSLDNGASWQNLSDGLPVGYHLFTDFAENSNKVIYTSVLGSGVYGLAKGSSLWQSINAGLTDLTVYALDINTSDNIFCGTLDEGVFRLITSSWTNVNNGLLNPRIRDIYIDKKTDKILLATEHRNGGGVFSSIDNGKSWQDENQGFRGVRVWDMTVNPLNNNIFAGSYYNGVYRSIDGGANWEPASTGLTENQSTYIRTIASSPTGDIYIATYGGGAYKTIDDGGYWSNISPNGFGDFYHAVAVRKSDGAVFLGGYTGTAGVLRSDDGGNNWVDIANNIPEVHIRAIDFNETGHIYVSTDKGGIFKSSDNGANWQKRSNSTLDDLDIYELSVSPAGTIFVGAWANGAYKSKDDGLNWVKIDDLGSQSLDFVYDARGTIYAGSYDPWRSKDGGNTWENINSGMGATVMESYTVDTEGFVYAGTSKGVYKTVEPSGAVRVQFEVKLAYQDGFDPDNQEVVVRGWFNNWGQAGDLVLEPMGDADMTYVGEWATTSPEDVIVDGNFEYKFVIPGRPDIWEVLLGNRLIPWDGQEDLILEHAWFDDQLEFTRMITGEMLFDTARSRGVAWGDYDNDGFADLYISNFGEKDFLYHNKQNGDMVKEVDFPEEGASYGVSWGDYDNDADLDLFISDLGGENNLRFENSGSGVFNKITTGPEVSEGGNTVTSLWLDFDQDGLLDLFAANTMDENSYLYRNLGDNTFEKIITGQVVQNSADSWGASAADFDNDGDMDLFVANADTLPGGKNFLYINQGDGTFLQALPGNPVVDDVGQNLSGSWGDYNNDGLLDLYVANVGDAQPNMLYKNMGEGVFKKVTTSIVSSDSASSRSTSWIDFDNDGWLDLFVVNSGSPNVMYRNTGDGNFEHDELGPVSHDLFSNRGNAWADYDRDGDLDVVMTGAADQPNYIYRNNLQGQNWSEYKLIGTISNKAAIGARVKLKAMINGNPLWQLREISSQTGQLSQNEMIAHFGLGKATTIDSVIVIWPGGNQQVISPPGINKRIEIIETTPEYPVPILVTPKNGAIDVDLYPEFTWNVADNAISYTIQLSTSSDFSNLIIAIENLTGTHYQLPTNKDPLEKIKNHFWRVKAVMNASGVGNWSDVWNFTTKRDTTFLQVLKVVSPPDNATNVALTPALEWTWIDTPPVGDIITYDVQLSSSPEFSDTLWQVNDISGSSATINDFDFEYNKSYLWRVRAKTSSIIYIWSDPPWMFTTESFTGTVNLLYPENNAPNVSVPAPLMWTSVPAEGYRIQVDTSTDFDNLVLDVNSTPDDTLIYINQSMEFKTNSQYFWRVGVISGGDVPSENWSITYMFETFDEKVDTDFFLTFPEYTRRDEYQTRDYVIVGLPGNSGMAFNQVFTGVAGEDWMAYWDNGNTNATQPEDYLIPYSVSSTFTFTTGRAFWVINKGDIRINQSDLGVFPLNEMAEAEIHVHAGYNLITSPFDKPVSWAQIKFVNELPVSTPLYEFDNDQGKFVFSETLERGIGYYFINSTNVSPLRVPFNPIHGLSKVKSGNTFEWKLSIGLKSGESEDETSMIGISNEAKSGHDELEYNKPRMLKGIASVYFERPEWDENYPIFGSDVRPEINESETWVIKVYTPDAAKSELSFAGIENIPLEYMIALIDKKAARVQDLRENDAYHFAPLEEITEFEIMVGNRDIINDRIAEIVPHNFALEQNYPNPFNPTTTIPIALPKNSQIKVTIYNILGKVINVLYNGIAESGRHFYQWNGTDLSGKRVASGLYFYRLEIEGRKSYTKKMVLMK